MFISFAKRNLTPLLNRKKCEGREKRDRLLVSKVDFLFQISLRNKTVFLVIQFSPIGLILSKKS